MQGIFLGNQANWSKSSSICQINPTLFKDDADIIQKTFEQQYWTK